jgi:multicomponent Na+:H+ antiporter subunit D
MSAVLLIIIPLLAAFISILSKKVAPYLLGIVAVVNVVLIVSGLLPQGAIIIGGFDAPYGIELIYDEFAFFGLVVVNTLFLITVLFNIKEYKKMATILLVALVGLNGLLLTGDLFNLFVFLEITAISAYLITTTNKQPVHTFHYLVAGTVGSSLYLLGLILLYSMVGTLNMADMASALASVNTTQVAFPFLLMFIGLGVEVKLLPFNGWVKGILGHSNRLSGPMIAGIYAGATLFVFGRLISSVFVISDALMQIILIVLGISILAGEAMAYSSSKVKDILLFSSVAQAGIALLVFMYGFIEYALLFVALAATSKVVLFLVFNTIMDGSGEVEELKGFFAKNVLLGIGVTAVILSLLGLPLFIGFAVKLGILMSLFDAGQVLFPVLILVSSVIEGVYFIKLLITLWHGESNKEVAITWPLLVFTSAIAIALVVFGTYMSFFSDFIDNYLMIGGIF